MRPLEIKILKFSGCAFLAIVLASFLFPIFAFGNPATKSKACLSHLRQQANGLLLYADDHDDRLALRDAWMNDLQLVVKSEEIFHDPEGVIAGYGYAFNAALSHAKLPLQSEKWPMVYDSIDLARNASDRVASLPRPGRHDGKDSVAYADGHARSVKAP